MKSTAADLTLALGCCNSAGATWSNQHSDLDTVQTVTFYNGLETPALWVFLCTSAPKKQNNEQQTKWWELVMFPVTKRNDQSWHTAMLNKHAQ